MEIFQDARRDAHDPDDPLEYVGWAVRIDGEDRLWWPAAGYESDQQLAEHALNEFTESAPENSCRSSPPSMGTR